MIHALKGRCVMAVKTITIDLEAYELLAGAKRGNESFSKAIKRILGPSSSARRLLDGLPDVLLEAGTLDCVDRLVAARSESLAASKPLNLPG
jgi:predicted CopG family antitoxin